MDPVWLTKYKINKQAIRLDKLQMAHDNKCYVAHHTLQNTVYLGTKNIDKFYILYGFVNISFLGILFLFYCWSFLFHCKTRL